MAASYVWLVAGSPLQLKSRYAPIEGGALAVAYALHQTRYYVLGCPDLIIATDHKLLLQVLNDRSLTEIHNRRLLNLKEKTLRYRFTMAHVPGKRNLGPDAASRYPTGPALSMDLTGEPPEMDSLACVLSHLSDTLAGLSQIETDIDFAADTCLVAAATVALCATTTVVT